MPELDEKKRIIAYDTVNDPDENYYALIDNGTAGTGKVSIKGLGPADMISDQYSDSSTYKVGNLCIHNNKLYVCTVDINTPHAFNLSEWELDTLGNYATKIKQSLSQSSTQFDAATGVTKIATNMGKSGSLATIALTLQKVFVSQNTSVTMGTLPSGYRPSYVVRGACRNETKGTTLGFTIETNGDVKVQTNTTTVDSVAQNIMINASFMV